MATLNQGLGVKAGGSGGGGGGTDTNLGNTDLTADAARVYDVNGNNLTFEDGTTDIMQLNATSNNLQIGATSKYSMPTARGSQNEVLGLTNSTGNAAWRTMKVTNPAPPIVGGGIGSSSITPTATDIFTIKRDGTLFSPMTTTATSISIANLVDLGQPFRSIANTNFKIAVGNDESLLVKIANNNSGYLRIPVQFWVIAVNLGTGQSATTPAAAATNINSSTVYEIQAAPGFTCFEVTGLSGLVASACTNYYLGFTMVSKGAIPASTVTFTYQYQCYLADEVNFS